MAGRDYRVTGKPPDTDTLGFRWNAFNNLFWTAADVGAREWRAARDPDEENAKKLMHQFVWAIPYDPPALDLTKLEYHEITKRVRETPRGHVPVNAEHFTIAIDLGTWQCHWTALAFDDAGSPQVVDYGVVVPPSHAMDVDLALMIALREWRDMVEAGWPIQGQPEAERRVPDLAWIDSSWKGPEVAYPFVRESDAELFGVVKGLGVSQAMVRKYTQPRQTGNVVKYLGQDYHAALLQSEGVLLWEVNADSWKSWIHERLHTPLSEPGAFALFNAKPQEHTTYAKQLAAERQVSEFVAGKGTVVRWENSRRRQNHYLDATYMACAAGHLAGVRLFQEQVEDEHEPRRCERVTAPDGRPFLVTER